MPRGILNTYKPDVTALSNWNITTTTGVAPLQSNYKEPSISYDRNGNILSYQRWGASTTTIQDNLTYNYIAGTNKLSSVTDASTSATTGEVTTQAANNYTYDGAGNLLTDAQGNASITWSPYGKVLQVYRAAFASTTLFGYDAMQNRVKKQQTSLSSNISTFYIRDAQGNVLAVYEKNGSTITWKEQHLYGSSRLGTVEPGVAWTATPGTVPYFRSTRILNYGWKRYEVNDHLGNVRALINDRKAYNGTTFTATLLDATDYFPFGAEMRKAITVAGYRYGFNGKELDKNGEFGGLNHYDYGFRIYNPGIGRFLSVDPFDDHPNQIDKSPYAYAWDDPVNLTDPDGRCPICLIAKAGASAAIDIVAQVVVNHYIGGQDWESSFNNIDWRQAGISAVEGLNPFKTPGGKYGKAALTAIGDVVINAATSDGNYTLADAGEDFLVGMIAQIGAEHVGDYFKKYKALNNGVNDAADDGVVFTADLSKTKATSRSGHRNAGNKQIYDAMEKDPKLKSKLQKKLGEDVFDRTSTSDKGRLNPKDHEWDHNSDDPNKLDLRHKDNHAEKTSNDPGRRGGFSKYWKDKNKK